MSFGLNTSSPTFDPAQRGTPESSWEAALRDAPLLSLPASAIVVVSPHPDDEVLGAGGLIRSAAQAGHQVTVLSVTDGEAAYPDWKGLDRIRRREVRDALSVLVPQTVCTRHLSLPDGKVDQNRATLSDAIDRRLSRNAAAMIAGRRSAMRRWRDAAIESPAISWKLDAGRIRLC